MKNKKEELLERRPDLVGRDDLIPQDEYESKKDHEQYISKVKHLFSDYKILRDSANESSKQTVKFIYFS